MSGLKRCQGKHSTASQRPPSWCSNWKKKVTHVGTDSTESKNSFDKRWFTLLFSFLPKKVIFWLNRLHIKYRVERWVRKCRKWRGSICLSLMPNAVTPYITVALRRLSTQSTACVVRWCDDGALTDTTIETLSKCKRIVLKCFTYSWWPFFSVFLLPLPLKHPELGEVFQHILLQVSSTDCQSKEHLETGSGFRNTLY